MSLVYHKRLQELFGEAPEISEHNLRQVNLLEQYHRIQLPQAVKELFSLATYDRILNGNDDHPITLDGFYAQTSSLTNHDPKWGRAKFKSFGAFSYRGSVEDDYFLFMYENQGVYHWAVLLGVGDDPPVLIRENRPNRPWIPSALRFTDFVYGRLFDWGTDLDEHGFYVNDKAVSDEDFAYLASVMQPDVITRSISRWMTYRYRGDGFRVSIMQPSDNANQSHWQVYADTPDKIHVLLECLQPIGNVVDNLNAFIGDDVGQVELYDWQKRNRQNGNDTDI